MSEKNGKNEEEQPPYILLGLRVEDIKRAELVDLTPDRYLTVLRGDNGAGKSSVGDAFVYAVGGKRVRPAEMLRRGAEEGRIHLDIGTDHMSKELNVDLVVREDGKEFFEVSNADEVPQKSPQTLMDQLIGPARTQFDPLSWLAKSKAEKAEHVRQCVGLDFKAIDEEMEAAKGERLLVGREVKSLQARFDAIPRPPADAPKPIDTMALLKEQEELLQQEREREQLASVAREQKTKLDAVSNEFRTCESTIAQMQARIVEAEAALVKMRQELTNAEALKESIRQRGEKQKEATRVARINAEQAPDPSMRLTMIRSELEEAEKHTEAALKLKERERVGVELKGKEEEHKALEKKLHQLEAKKLKMISEAKFPLEGMGFTPSGTFTFKGFDFEEASQAEQIRVAVALGLAAKPRLRTMWIKQGSVLDENSLGLLYETLVEFKAQAIVEIPRKEGRGPCVVIEAGRVAEVRNS